MVVSCPGTSLGACVDLCTLPESVEYQSCVANCLDLCKLDDVCTGLPDGAFCEDFSGNDINTERWWYGRKQWGPQAPFNHGVIPENVRVADGIGYFAATGNNYTGNAVGVRKVGGGYIQDQPGSKTAGMIISDRYFGSGSFEFRMKLPPQTGPCSAVWTFHYQEIYEGEPGYDDYVAAGNFEYGNNNIGRWVIPNHEIDIELPTPLAGAPDETASYRYVRYNTFIGEQDSELTGTVVDNGFEANDGLFHNWRFDWHTGGNGEIPRVEYYLDGELAQTITTNIPNIAGRVTIGTWYPTWAGVAADYDTTFLEVDWFKYTPFNEPNDRFVLETYPNDGMTKCQDKASNDAGLPVCRLNPPV